jgi:hypothetical protein
MSAVIRPVSNEARGKVRALMADLEIDAATMIRAFSKIPTRTLNCPEWKGKVGAQRAINRIIAAMPRPPDLRLERTVIWRFLRPVAVVPHDPGSQDKVDRPGLEVVGIVAAHRARPARPSSFGLAVTTHACGRLIDRSTREIDVAAAIYESHDCLLALPGIEGEAIFNLKELILPASDGMFLANPFHIAAGNVPIAVARTWVSSDMAHKRQTADLSVWHRLLEQAKA